MKALMLAAVMALGGTGASALDTYELLSKGTIISLNGQTQFTYFAYRGIIYYCSDISTAVFCWKMLNTPVKEE